MIAKNKKGKSFGGCVRYVLNEGHEILAAEGVVAEDAATIVRDFAIQRSGRPEILRPVGHIAVSFSPDDSERMTNDFMLTLAHEYMQEMNISNTQYIVVRHHNTDHEHFHIVYNRIDNDLKLISVNNDYHRNVAACKKLKDRHGLTYGVGKERVNRAKLTGADRVKYQIYDEIAANLPKCATYSDLEKRLRQGGISVMYKYRSGAEESPENIQGVSFRKGDYSFKGSQVDRAFSHANLSAAFNERMHEAVREFLSGDGATVQRPEQTAAPTVATLPKPQMPPVSEESQEPEPTEQRPQQPTPSAVRIEPPKQNRAAREPESPTSLMPEESRVQKPTEQRPAPPQPSAAAEPESTKPQARMQQPHAPEESLEPQARTQQIPAPEKLRGQEPPVPSSAAEPFGRSIPPVPPSPEKSSEQGPPTPPKQRPQETAKQLDLFAPSQPSAQEAPKQPEPSRQAMTPVIPSQEPPKRTMPRASKMSEQERDALLKHIMDTDVKPGRPITDRAELSGTPSSEPPRQAVPSVIPPPTSEPSRQAVRETDRTATPSVPKKLPEPSASLERQQPPVQTKQPDPEAVKREIHAAITDGLPHATHYADLEERLQKEGITVIYKYRSGAKHTENNIQGVSFEKDGIVFKGSDIDRRYSHANLSDTLKQNWADWFKANMEPDIRPVRRPEPPEPQQPPTPPPTQERQERRPVSQSPRYPVINGVEITAEQDRALNNGGHIWLENMDEGKGKFSGYVFYDDDKTKLVTCPEHPDKIIDLGECSLRMRDIALIHHGAVIPVDVTLPGETYTRRWFSCRDPKTGEIMLSESDPRIPVPQQSRVPETPKQPEPPRRVCNGVEITAEQWDTLQSGGHIYVENMTRRSDGMVFSSHVFLDDEKQRVFYSYENPDEFVEYGGYEMRRRDRMQVERGFTTRAVIRLSDGELTGARLWKDKPEDAGYNVSWDDPRVAQQQRERERQTANDSTPRPSAPDRTQPAAPTTKEQFEKANKEMEERLRRNYSPPKIIQPKGPKIGRRR